MPTVFSVGEFGFRRAKGRRRRADERFAIIGIQIRTGDKSMKDPEYDLENTGELLALPPRSLAERR